ncbi:MAG: histidine kinase [Atopobiaceae bacterium]|nr:histidine kinase [Atopobiaceae bacterium]
MIELSAYIAATAIISTVMVVAVLGLGLATVLPGTDQWSKRFFLCFFAILELCVFALTADVVSYGVPAFNPFIKAADFLLSLLLSIPVTMPTFFLAHCCEEDLRTNTLLRATLAMWVVYAALTVLSPFTDAFCYYSPYNEFHIGPWYPLLVAPLLAILTLELLTVVRWRNRLSKKRLRAFLVFLIPLLASIIVHMCTPAFELVYVGVTISSFAMFIIVVSDQIDQYMVLQQETAQQRARIAVLQMRPHFIHNTMTSIYYLCEQDPKEAQRITMDFNTYLRKNFNAIVKDETIPFAEELEHTRAYLAVEQAQYASKLVIEFDVSHEQFLLPPLTLQPLAENAVKHGMRPETVPLHVTIQSRKVGSTSEVIVEDNGPGFDPAIADNPHTTLANIRQRLEMMCGGRLEFDPREGGGTVARITIPS